MLVVGVKPGCSLELEWPGKNGETEHGTIFFDNDTFRIKAYIDAPRSLVIYRGTGGSDESNSNKAMRDSDRDSIG